MKRKKILVFPCGSEIGLEIHRSLRYSTHVELIGASSSDDHGSFVYENYLGDFPMVGDPSFVSHLQKAVARHGIDAVYPTMDRVLFKVKQHEGELDCIVIASPIATTEICYSKSATYKALQADTAVPVVYDGADSVTSYPVFVKPDKGYGSRGARQIDQAAQLKLHLTENPDTLTMELLTGPEVTVDCFTDRTGKLLFCGPRERTRVTNGISVRTATMSNPNHVFEDIAHRINKKLEFRGAWFFQVKANSKNEWVLLEIASRLAGSSGVHRMQGVNFALLSVFDAFGENVNIQRNSFAVTVDRALDSRFRISLVFDHAYIDLDDTLVIDDRLNPMLIALVVQFMNDGIGVTLITKHEKILQETLEKYRIGGLFKEILHLKKTDRKIDFIKNTKAIFIDDSYAERKEVMENLRIPVFSPDAIECLLH